MIDVYNNPELVRKAIKSREDRIRFAAQGARFGDPTFSDWYEGMIDEINELKSVLKYLEEEKEKKK